MLEEEPVIFPRLKTQTRKGALCLLGSWYFYGCLKEEECSRRVNWPMLKAYFLSVDKEL